MIIVEDGSGVEDANSYVSVEDCDAYHEGHLYADDWNFADVADKEKAVRMATRTIDVNTQYDGTQVEADQALAWPRSWAYNPDAPTGTTAYWAADAVPKPVRDATCELARELLKGDRTQEDATKGIKLVGVGQGAVVVAFDPADRKTVFTETVELFLRKVGRPAGYAATVPVYRI